MPELMITQPIDVRVPNKDMVQGRRFEITQKTALFREDIFSAHVLGATQERVGDPEIFSFASIGCSIGTEVDSVLTLYNNSSATGIVASRGFDASGAVIPIAEEGKYTLSSPCFGEDCASHYGDYLRDLGFEVSLEPQENDGMHFSYVHVDASSVREGHDVQFIQHNATQPLPNVENVHLAMANNLLYHHPDEVAIVIARNIATVLADNGVISFGKGFFSVPASQPVAEMLRDEFELVPLLEYGEAPEMYGRL